MKGLLITPEASVTELVPANGRDFTLEELQKSVDGCIEIIDLTPKTIMIVNEDGKGRMYPDSHRQRVPGNIPE